MLNKITENSSDMLEHIKWNYLILNNYGRFEFIELDLNLFMVQVVL